MPAKYLNCGITSSAIENKKIGSKAKINNKIKIFLFLFFLKIKKGVNIINKIILFSIIDYFKTKR